MCACQFITLKTNKILLKIGLFALLLLSAVGAWAASNVNGKTFYLQTGVWNAGNAWFQMYCFKDGGSANYWVTMKNVCGDLYVGTAPTSGDYNRVIFVRRAPNTDGNNWNNVWNQTANLNPSNSNNKYDITGWSSGTWYNHSPALPRGTYIYFDNSQTKWSKVWMSEVCGCNNRDRNADDYKPKEDCYWYQMEQYCGSIYRVKLAQDAYYGSFSFFAGDQSGYDNVYSTSTVLHVGLDENNPMVIPCESTFNTSRQTYVWSCSIKSAPGPKAEAGTRIFFNNSKTQWDNVYMSESYGCNVYMGIDSYSPKKDANWYKMKQYCGDIYYVDLTAPACTGLFSFFSTDEKNFNDVYATDCLLHYGYNPQYPVFNPYIRSEYNETRRGYEWSGDLKALPNILSAPLSSIELSTTVTNPVHRGTTVTLSTSDLSQSWIWYQSTSGTSYSSTTAGVSGSKNQNITVTPVMSTYYKIKDPLNICSATYRVEIDIECNGDKKTLLDLNFDTNGSGAELSSYQARRAVVAANREAVNTAIYAYSPENKEILDGFYAILANPYYGGRGLQKTSTSCHTTSCLQTASTLLSDHAWYNDIKDHTHGGASDGHIGGMLMANCKEKEEVIFEYTTEKLCGHNLFMTFSAWFANATAPDISGSVIPINAQIRIMNEARTEEVAHIDVVNVKPNAEWAKAWKEGRSSFFSGDNDKLVIQIVNYGESGTGNDILIDDIRFTACVPRVDAKPTTNVDCGENTTLEVDPDGIAEIFDGTPYYLWQRWNYSSGTWVSIADDPDPDTDVHGGSGWGKTIYTFATEEHPEGEKPKFRVIMSNDRAVAHQVGDGNPPDCVNFAVTDDIIVDCTCVPQTIDKTSGSAEQTVCEGNSIASVVYKSGGTANKNAAAKGLPDGITATKSGKNLTISGTLPVIDKDSTYIIKVFAEGTAGVSCPSDTLELVINSKRKPSLTLNAGDLANQSICEKTNDAAVDVLNDYLIEDIHYIWGGSATDVTITQSPAPTASQAGIDVGKTPADKTITISGSPARTTTYTVRTTGQNSACAAAVKTGTITVNDVPSEPPLKYRQIQ